MGPEAIKALISSVMEKQGLDIMGLASKLGVNADMIGGFLNGSSIPGADIIQKLMGMNAPEGEDLKEQAEEAASGLLGKLF